MLNASQNTKFSPWNTVQKRPGLTNSFLFDLKDDKRLAVSEPWLLNDCLIELNAKQIRIMKWTAYGFEAAYQNHFMLWSYQGFAFYTHCIIFYT